MMSLTQNHYITNNNWNLWDFLTWYMSLSVSLSSFLSLRVSLYVSLCLHDSVYMSLCLCLRVSISPCLNVYMSLSLHVSLHVPNCGFWQHDSYYHFYENYRLLVTQNQPPKMSKNAVFDAYDYINNNNWIIRPILSWYLSPTVDFDNMVAISACIKIIGLGGNHDASPSN